MYYLMKLGQLALLSMTGGLLAIAAETETSEFHGKEHYEPNMITTAHIRPSLFQPGSGAGAYPAPYYSDVGSLQNFTCHICINDLVAGTFDGNHLSNDAGTFGNFHLTDDAGTTSDFHLSEFR